MDHQDWGYTVYSGKLKGDKARGEQATNKAV